MSWPSVEGAQHRLSPSPSLTSHKPMRSLLLQIRSSAEAGAQKYSSYVRPSRASTSSVPLSMVDLTLPDPQVLTPQLVALGVDKSSAERISSTMLRSALRLKASCEAGYVERRRALLDGLHPAHDVKFLSRIPQAYRMLYDKTIHDWSTYLVTSLAPRILAAQETRQRTGSQRESPSKRPFNQSAVPLLERFFDDNAFPSRLDKYELASKCNMEYRQIHTWFQNRRSRFRKEGKPLSQPTRGSSLLEELEKSVVDTLLPEAEDVEDGHMLPHPVVEPACLAITSPLLSDVPKHAFPATYPPLCSYDPFPASPEERGLQLPWIRKPWSTEVRCCAELNVDDLTAHFANLCIGDVSPEPCASVVTRRQPRCHTTPLSFGFSTLCPHAPHPALVRRAYRPNRHRFAESQAAADSACAPNAHHPPRRPLLRSQKILGSHPKPLECIDSARAGSATSTSPSPKRTLPRRMPKNPPLTHSAHSLSPSSPDCVADSVHINSRASSVSSFVTDSSSTRSPTSSPLSTPPPLVPELPRPDIYSPKPEDLRDALATFEASPLDVLQMDVFLNSAFKPERCYEHLHDPLAY